MKHKNLSIIALSLILFACFAIAARAQATAFTYQGRLTDASAAANGAYDFQFALFDAATGGTQQPPSAPVTLNRSGINVTNGVFTVELDFGTTPFAGAGERYLEIRVKKPTDPNYTPLSPRQKLTSAPYSIRSLSAAAADALSANCNLCVTNAQISSIDGSKVSGAVASATTAATAGNVSGVVAIANGGTGSVTQNFVDLTTNQTIGGNKTFSGIISGNGSGLTNLPASGGVSWQTVTGTAVQAQSNRGYIASNGTAQVVITLPASPSVGDIVRVTGAGAGGWRVAQNSGQFITGIALDLPSQWTPRESSRLWTAVASSADGTRLVAAADGGQIYTSTDSGATWTPRDSGRSWRGVASSADGTKLAAAASGGQIYTSTDSGATWTPRETSRNWQSVASSADGTKLVAVASTGRIYTSADSGVTWTPRESSRNWQSVASSADGSELVVVVSGGQIYTSANSGVTWMPRESSRNWSAVASSADGTRLAATAYTEQIYTAAVGVTTVLGAGYLTGAAKTAVELLYVGGGEFMIISSQGAISSF